MKQERTELKHIQKYQERGYTSSFRCENGFLVELKSKKG